MDASLIWRALRARYRDQKTELSVIRDAIRPDDLVCDIGANKGSYLFWLAKWGGRVIAFEPQPPLAAYLRTSFPRVVVEAKGVFSKSGEQSLYMPEVNSPGATLAPHAKRDAGTTISIPVVALDDYFAPAERPALLKIDVEGAEVEVFKGAQRILRDSKPVLIFECEGRHLNGREVTDVFDYLQNFGYEGHFINGGALQPIADFNPSRHQRETDGRFWDRPDYCNNFVFR